MGNMNAQTADVSKVTYATLHINTYLTGDTKRVMPDLLLLTKIILREKYTSQHLFTNKSVTSEKILDQ